MHRISSEARRLSRRMQVRLSVVVLAMGVLACSTESGPGDDVWRSPIPFDTAGVRIIAGQDTTEVLVEIAASEAQQMFGLMTRPNLDGQSGMIFVYSTVQDSSAGFWMYRTLVPLDIAFIDSAGRIASIRSMPPCESEHRETCPVYPPGTRYASALEVNRGFFEQHGIEVGDSVALVRRGNPE
jgi:uncharacterized protein